MPKSLVPNRLRGCRGATVMLWCSPPAEVMLPKSRKNSTREERIDYEIVVDAYGPEERAMGWYYYLQDKLGFPFRAKCTASRVVSPLLIRWHDRKVAIPLSQLTAIDENESADQALADWMGSARLPILNLSGPNLSYAALPKGHGVPRYHHSRPYRFA